MPRFLTCATCGPESWVRTDKVWQRPVCPWCGNAWPKRQVQNRPKRARIPAPLRRALEAMWPAMPDPAKRALEEAGYQPPEAAKEEKDLVELLRTFEDKLPSEVIAALPTKPTLGPIEEGREVADKYAEAVRDLRILGREKLDLQSRIDTSKANLLVQLKKMQQIQEDIRKAQDKVNQETLVYQQKVLDQTEDPDPVDLVLKALGMSGGLTDAQLTEEQKRRLEAIKEEEAKRRRVQVETSARSPVASSGPFECWRPSGGVHVPASSVLCLETMHRSITCPSPSMSSTSTLRRRQGSLVCTPST